MEYRESLEERGVKSSEEIDKKVALLRKKHEADYGLVDGQWLSSQDQDMKGAGGLQASGDYISYLLICGIIPMSFLLSSEVGMSYILPWCFVSFYFCCSWLKLQFSSAMGMLVPHILRQFLS
jgi:hypothetical protein